MTDTPLIQIHWCINERIQRSPFWSTVERLSTYLSVQNVFDRCRPDCGPCKQVSETENRQRQQRSESVTTLLPSVSTIALVMFCGAKCTFTLVIKHHWSTTANIVLSLFQSVSHRVVILTAHRAYCVHADHVPDDGSVKNLSSSVLNIYYCRHWLTVFTKALSTIPQVNLLTYRRPLLCFRHWGLTMKTSTQ